MHACLSLILPVLPSASVSWGGFVRWFWPWRCRFWSWRSWPAGWRTPGLLSRFWRRWTSWRCTECSFTPAIYWRWAPLLWRHWRSGFSLLSCGACCHITVSYNIAVSWPGSWDRHLPGCRSIAVGTAIGVVAVVHIRISLPSAILYSVIRSRSSIISVHVSLPFSRRHWFAFWVSAVVSVISSATVWRKFPRRVTLWIIVEIIIIKWTITHSMVITPAVAPVIISPPVPDIYIENYRRVPVVIVWIRAPVPVISIILIVPAIIVVILVIITPSVIIYRVVERKSEAGSVSSVNAWSPRIRLVVVPICISKHWRVIVESWIRPVESVYTRCKIIIVIIVIIVYNQSGIIIPEVTVIRYLRFQRVTRKQQSW